MSRDRNYCFGLVPEYAEVARQKSKHPHYGYRRITALMRLQGWEVSHYFVRRAIRAQKEDIELGTYVPPSDNIT